MRERPILFKGEMVKAILEGRKTQTRRIIKPQPYQSDRIPPGFPDTKPGDIFICPDRFPTNKNPGKVIAECESLGCYHVMGVKQFVKKHSPFGKVGDRLWVRETWKQVFNTPAIYAYRATEPHEINGGKWKPSIFMPRQASRITLEITNIRVERLQDIDDEQAGKEGIMYFNYKGPYCDSGRLIFKQLWESINGKESWKDNPYVWVVEFEVVK